MLTLNVPDIDDSGRQHKAETRLKATTEWLARLPFASPVDTAQQLITALYALNRQPLDAVTRQSLLTLYRPVVSRVAANLETLLAEAGVPPHAQQRQTGILMRELLIEYAIGYKHVLLALTAPDAGRTTPKQLAEIAARLLAALRDIRVASYVTNKKPPEGLWLEKHQIYQLAVTTGLADKAMGDAAPASLAYRQALLLALADPPHMSRGELAHARQFLEGFGALAMLREAAAQPEQHGFTIPTDSDRGPAQPGVDARGSDLLLDTEALCRHLHEAIIRLRTGDSPRRVGLPHGMESELSLRVGKKLLKQWRSGAERAFKRYPVPDRVVQVVAGVSAIHRLLVQAAEVATDADDSLPIGDVEMLYAAPAAIHASRWTIRNDSAAGLALAGTPDTPLNLKVGDPLALRADDDTAMWSLAVIRWIVMHDAGRVELGVERMAPHMQPVWVRRLRGLRKATEPALFVPGLAALKQPDRLLLPRHVYEPGMDAEIWHDPRQYTLTFGRRLEHTPSFDLIDFTLFV